MDVGGGEGSRQNHLHLSNVFGFTPVIDEKNFLALPS